MNASRRFAALVVALVAIAPGPGRAEIQLLASDPLLVAAFAGDTAVARRLLLGGKSPNTSDNDDRTALMWAVIAGRVDAAATIVEFKPRLDFADKFGNTALYYAADRGDPELTELLLKAGATVDAENRQGQTPLMAAARKGALFAVQALLAAKADARRPDYTGMTALDWAREGRSPAVLRLLEAAR